MGSQGVVLGDGRGVAGTLHRVLIIPGHHTLRRPGRWRQDITVEIRIIDGHRATDRRGAAEYLGKSFPTIRGLASKRDETHFPIPAHVEVTGRGVRTLPDGTKQGREWYRLDHLDTFRTEYLDRVAAEHMPRSHGRQLAGNPDELLGAADFAADLGITLGAFMRYVADSRPRWDAYKIMAMATLSGDRAVLTEPVDSDVQANATDVLARYGARWQPRQHAYVFPGDARDAVKTLLAGEDFFLPYPDEDKPGRRGRIRKWRRSTIQAFIDSRPGTTASTGRPPVNR
jgi:hypothetical protein